MRSVTRASKPTPVMVIDPHQINVGDAAAGELSGSGAGIAAEADGSREIVAGACGHDPGGDAGVEKTGEHLRERAIAAARQHRFVALIA
jgi:hypothetical protein